MRFPPRRVAVVALLLVLAACKGPAGAELTLATTTTSSSTTTSTSTTSSSSTTTSTTPRAVTTPRVVAPSTRVVIDTGFRPFAVAGGELTLNYPTARVEVVGFHESKLAGARQLVALPDAGRFVDMASRERATEGHGAADVE